MKASKKWLACALVLTMGVCCAIGLAACGSGDEADDTLYTVTYARGADDATGEIPATESYAEGDTVTLKSSELFSRDGYAFSSWSDGDKTYAGGASYVMPAANVTFTAVWTENDEEEKDGEEEEDKYEITAIPASDYVTTSTVNGKTATAYWFAEYGADALEITVYVEDESIYTADSIYSGDGVDLLIGKVCRVKGYSEGAISVVADAAGNVLVKKASDNTAITDSGVTVGTEVISKDGRTVAGYRMTLSIPYAATEITKESKDAAICFGLTNADNAIKIFTSYDSSLGTDSENQHTFVALKDDNTFAENPYLQYGLTWGDAGALKASSVWDINNDDGTDDASITMTGLDGDSYIYMRSSNEEKMYAEVQISALSLENGENWSKFGIVVLTENRTGFAFYIDAASTNGSSFNTDAVALGYNMMSEGVWANNWSNIGTLGGTSEQYQNGSYVTLGIYRQGAVFKLYANGVCVKTVSGEIGSEEGAYVGLFTFNAPLTAKGYFVTTDQGEFPADAEITAETVDYLFIGDSYIDTAFWYTFGNGFGKLSSANIGVGGTKVGYWNSLAEALKVQYKPANIIVHIGVNDIDGGASAAETIALLDTMVAKYTAAFPNASIYYVTIEHNMLFKQFWSAYDTVNAHMKALNEIQIIDMASYITEDAEGSTMHWFNLDGLHYGVDGYALFDRMVYEALGIARESVNTASGLGDLGVEDAPLWSYTSGWEFDAEGVAHNAGSSYGIVGAESQLFISGAYAADFYAEAEISIAGCYSSDYWPKVGIALRSATGTYFYGIDANVGVNPNGYYINGWSNVWYRSEAVNTSAGAMKTNWGAEYFSSYQWIYNNQYPEEYPAGVSFDYNTDHSFIKLAVAKVGANVYLLSNGTVVNCIVNAYGEDELVAAAVFTFNMDVYAKNGVAITEESALQTKLDSLKIYKNTDGMQVDASMDDWTAAEKANVFSIPATDGRYVDFYAKMASDGLYVFAEAVHNSFVTTNANWYDSTNIELTVGNDRLQRFASANGMNSSWLFNARTVSASRFVSVAEGGKQHTYAELFIPYSLIDGYDVTSAYIPLTVAWKTGGETGEAWATGNDWWYAPDLHPYTASEGRIYATANGLKTGLEKTIDGDSSDWSDETFVSVGNAQYSLYLGADGLYLIVIYRSSDIDITKTNVDGDWWLNTNLEIRLPGHSVTSKLWTYGGRLYRTGFITDAAIGYTDGESEDTLVYEAFISYEDLGVASDTASVQIAFGGQLWNTDASNGSTSWNGTAWDTPATAVRK